MIFGRLEFGPSGLRPPAAGPQRGGRSALKRSDPLIRTFKDGTIKHWNYFTGQEAWSVPGRNNRPNLGLGADSERTPLPAEGLDRLCNFCPGSYVNTPPEKARLVKRGDSFEHQQRLGARAMQEEPAEFRRISNLFEITPLDYWQKNHGFKPSKESLAWQSAYLDTPEGLDHIRNVLRLKLERFGWPSDRIGKLTNAELRNLSLPFFAGSHELIVARRHLRDGAKSLDEICSSGDLTPEEHLAFLRFTMEALAAIGRKNPHITFVALFQNWLKPGGASFDHLHKQLVGCDDSGPIIGKILAQCAREKGAFKAYIEALIREDLVIASNDHGLAAADTGQPYPAAVVIAFSRAARPQDLDATELAGLSELIHACHAAWASAIPANEEWRYASTQDWKGMPVHVLLKWRQNISAGFEGATGIHITPWDPPALKEFMVDRLRTLKAEKGWKTLRIGAEGSIPLNAVPY
jgi:galactose-1-phosphate uridylyltransferase